MEIPNNIKQSLLEEKIEFIEGISNQLLEKIKNLTTKPGVYLHKNKDNKIIYVGKAKNLRNRIKSYFQQGRLVDAKTKAMVSHIADFDYIVVDTENEAFILEDNLIKKYKPKYNILLKDDKTFPYIKVTNEEFPKIFSTRRLVKDGAKYFGPYTDLRLMKNMLKIIRSLFYVRSCNLKLTKESIQKGKFKVCLDYHIHKCQAPCVGYISQEQYNENIKKGIQILLGKTKEVEKFIEGQMDKLAEEMKFEEAKEIRDKLYVLKDFSSNQKIVSTDLKNRDVFGMATLDDFVCTVIFTVREGKLLGRKHFIVKNLLQAGSSEIIQRTIENWYINNEFLPDEIFLPTEPEDLEYITDWLKKKFKSQVNISIPQIGEKRKLIEMTNSNAELILQDHISALESREKIISKAVLSLQRDLHLNKAPVRMECFDNSHIQGSDLVSSLVVFENGKPKKSDYRKFKNETVNRNDDFATMKEVVMRRYTRLLSEKSQLPDLIVIDGGKGQLSAAWEVLNELQIQNKITIIGLAKRLEEIFFPEKSDSLILPKSSSSLRLLQQIRDEAHRFAITYHRKLREKRIIHTQIEEIPGIGKKKSENLIKHFGSVKQIRQANFEQLKEIVSEKDANQILDYFKNNAD
jgi:excinuclease ABC subunit C